MKGIGNQLIIKNFTISIVLVTLLLHNGNGIRKCTIKYLSVAEVKTEHVYLQIYMKKNENRP